MSSFQNICDLLAKYLSRYYLCYQKGLYFSEENILEKETKSSRVEQMNGEYEERVRMSQIDGRGLFLNCRDTFKFLSQLFLKIKILNHKYVDNILTKKERKKET